MVKSWPIEMKINSWESKCNCFLKRAFLFSSLSLSLSLSFKCLLFKRILLGSDGAKACTFTKHCTRANVAVSLQHYLQFFPFFPGVNIKDYSNFTWTIIESYWVVPYKSGKSDCSQTVIDCEQSLSFPSVFLAFLSAIAARSVRRISGTKTVYS